MKSPKIIDVDTPYAQRKSLYHSLEDEIVFPFEFKGAKFVVKRNPNKKTSFISVAEYEGRTTFLNPILTRYLATLAELKFVTTGELINLYHNMDNGKQSQRTVLYTNISALRIKLSTLLDDNEPFYQDFGGYYYSDITKARNKRENIIAKNGLELNLITRVLNNPKLQGHHIPHLTDDDFKLLYRIFMFDNMTYDDFTDGKTKIIAIKTIKSNISILNSKLGILGYKIQRKPYFKLEVVKGYKK